MNLSEQINNQYNKRSGKAHLYQDSEFRDAAQDELRRTAESLLSSYFNDLSKVTVIEIGAGNGTNAFMFEKMGVKLQNIAFNELIKERIENIRSNFPGNKVYAGDAISVQFQEKYDIVFQSTVFTSVLNDDDRKKLADKMWDLLNPGGIILWYDFIYNNPKNPDVKKVSVSETRSLFKKAIRSTVKKITLAPPIGRRIGRFYHLFNVPFLRTHILAVFQKGKSIDN